MLFYKLVELLVLVLVVLLVFAVCSLVCFCFVYLVLQQSRGPASERKHGDAWAGFGNEEVGSGGGGRAIVLKLFS